MDLRSPWPQSAVSGERANGSIRTNDPDESLAISTIRRREPMLSETSRFIIQDGPHTTEVCNVLRPDLGETGLQTAISKASRIIELAVDPIGGPPPEPSDGLLYGLIQSGKTSILTVSAAMAADNGFKCILILTSDNDPLYEQTLERIRAALRGLAILGKKDWSDPVRFSKQLRSSTFGIVCSKNGSMLKSLLNAFKKAGAKGLSVFIIDDEADQASLNTFTSKKNGSVSTVNSVISSFRAFFPVNTYLQVTATPQALFLQRPGHDYRPSFAVITEPGEGYVGGDAFFGAGRGSLLRYVDLNELAALNATNQPTPSTKVPKGLEAAVFTFLVAAGARVINRPTENFAFLCHVSMSNKDHEYVRLMLDDMKQQTITALAQPGKPNQSRVLAALRAAYDDLSTTEANLPTFEDVVAKVTFYLQGATVKVVNASSSDEIKLDSVFSLFVGGNKLGRGVTIKNLLVSYYGRNPKKPRADTVLQHARMYGYRKKDVGVTRLFLPKVLADHFTSIHEMESSLRDVLKQFPDGAFEGLYISGNWTPTRPNVLDANSIGTYEAGASYNPESPLRTKDAVAAVLTIDAQVDGLADAPPAHEVSIDLVTKLIRGIPLDPMVSPKLWNVSAIETALMTWCQRNKTDKAYLVLQRGRALTGTRGERKGIISGGEESLAPTTHPTLFLYRQKKSGTQEAAWWPQIRFPDGNYIMAFSFNW